MFKILERIFLFCVITALFFVLFEGCSSTLLMLLDNAPRKHSVRQYDSLLGWTGIPSVSIPDFWGPGNHLRTNAQGFRNDADIGPQVAEGQIRVFCSGDSFAFGQGVGNDYTWCHRLSSLGSRIESVNIGQSGYGIDQAYLRYKRDAAAFEHSIHLFTFVAADLTRVGLRDHHGFPKPVLRLDGSELLIESVPVPRGLPAAKRWLRTLVKSLRSVELMRRLPRLLAPDDPSSSWAETRPAAVKPGLLDRVAPVATRVFEETHELGKERGASTVFVYLPTWSDLFENKPWRARTHAVMDSLGFHFVDLTGPLRALPGPVTEEFFIPEELSAGGHYTRAGNAWVAEVLYEHIRSLPALADSALTQQD